MTILHSVADLARLPGPLFLAIGVFDGVHLGHQSVIAEVIARARFLSGTSLAITFDPHPACVLRPNSPFPLITPLPRKLELLAATGIDHEMQRLAAGDAARFARLAGEARQLMLPGEMGERFKVMARLRGMDLELRGMALVDLRGSL